jgi:hypothetical protein
MALEMIEHERHVFQIQLKANGGTHPEKSLQPLSSNPTSTQRYVSSACSSLENNHLSNQKSYDATTPKLESNSISSLEPVSPLQTHHDSSSDLFKSSSSTTSDTMKLESQQDSPSHSTTARDITFYFKQQPINRDTPFPPP